MQPPRISIGFLLALLVFLAQACRPSAPEQGVIDGFFRAARARDGATLGGIALVAFDPAREGIVEACTVTAVGPEQRRPLHLKGFAAGDQGAHPEAMASERGLAHISINNRAFASTSHEGGIIDPSLYDGTIVTKDYTVSAKVRKGSGAT